MNNTKENLIEKLEDVISMFDSSCQECLEEVETVVGWFDVNDEEKKEVVKYFKEEYSDYKWASRMIKNVFTYVSFRPELVS